MIQCRNITSDSENSAADSVGKRSCWQYCGFTSDIYFCGRALQSPIAWRLETISSASGDASYIWFSSRMEHVFCEISIFQQNLGKR